jgi:hypothetical protein
MRALQFTADMGVSYSRQFRGKNLTKIQFSSSDEINSTPTSSTFVVDKIIPLTFLYSVNKKIFDSVIYVSWIQLMYIRLLRKPRDDMFRFDFTSYIVYFLLKRTTTPQFTPKIELTTLYTFDIG